MELGALVCNAQNPSCAICPVKTFCQAYRRDQAENFPIRQKRKKIVKVEATAVVLTHQNKYFIRKRPVGNVMGGLWEFPEWKASPSHAFKHLERDFGVRGNPEHLKDIKRNYTHHNETLRAFLLEVPNKVSPQNPSMAWEQAWITTSQFRRYPFSSAHAKIAQLLRDSP
jgi:A/G-specific adenine glycosylase